MCSTNFLKDSSNPEWNEKFEFYTDIEPNLLDFLVYDRDPGSLELLGEGQIIWDTL